MSKLFYLIIGIYRILMINLLYIFLKKITKIAKYVDLVIFLNIFHQNTILEILRFKNVKTAK